MNVLLGHDERALRILTSSAGVVQPRVVAGIERLIGTEVEAGHFVSPVAPDVLADAFVRMTESVLYNDSFAGDPSGLDRQREVVAALLGVLES
jgi:hypothetical protein